MHLLQSWWSFDSWVNGFLSPGDSRLSHLPLMGSPIPVILILVVYVYFVTSLGPRLMTDRKPFRLHYVLMIYNFAMVVLSITQFIRGGIYGWFGSYSYTCQPVDYSNSWQGLGMAYTAYVYFISKIIELLDTVFFILRKKFDQVTLLHVSHHASLVWFMYWGVKYFAGGHGSFQGFANSFVHIFVYSYYFLSGLGPKVNPYLWWKKYLTQLQIAQFVIIFIHTFQLVFQPSCSYPKWILVPYCGVVVYFLVMFINFYQKAYLKRKESSLTTTTDQKPVSTSADHKNLQMRITVQLRKTTDEPGTKKEL